jgi:hypothetical protein
VNRERRAQRQAAARSNVTIHCLTPDGAALNQSRFHCLTPTSARRPLDEGRRSRRFGILDQRLELTTTA